MENTENKSAKKPIYKKWWLWAIVVIVIAVIASSSGKEDNSGASSSKSSSEPAVEIAYEQFDLQAMIDDLKDNAMKAENTYKNKYVEVSGKISNFDSDGKYISIEPVNADEWNFDSVQCYIKNDTQKEVVMEKSKGDTVTIKGKIKSVGEVLGYSLDIDEIN